MSAYRHEGGCHCGAIGVLLETPRAPDHQVIGLCQCGFCRSHNARAFRDPASHLTLTAHEPEQVRHYSFGLGVSTQVICGRCGVYVAMLMRDGSGLLSVMNISTLADRSAFTHPGNLSDYDAETVAERLARRRAGWMPARLTGWPELPILP